MAKNKTEKDHQTEEIIKRIRLVLIAFGKAFLQDLSGKGLNFKKYIHTVSTFI